LNIRLSLPRKDLGIDGSTGHSPIPLEAMTVITIPWAIVPMVLTISPRSWQPVTGFVPYEQQFALFSFYKSWTDRIVHPLNKRYSLPASQASLLKMLTYYFFVGQCLFYSIGQVFPWKTNLAFAKHPYFQRQFSWFHPWFPPKTEPKKFKILY